MYECLMYILNCLPIKEKGENINKRGENIKHIDLHKFSCQDEIWYKSYILFMFSRGENFSLDFFST